MKKKVIPMRPVRLKISGLNSFREEQIINFSKLIDKGLFGIFGPTGSGKSSILDAITMALYGKISRDTNEFINTECDSLYVYFEFEMGNREKNYRVERNLKKKESGGYLTTSCRLVYKNKNGEKQVYDKVGDINNEIENIIGLRHKDFVRSVVLPQGKFSKFLKLKNKPRRDMLERIFNLEEFGRKLMDKIKDERNIRQEKVSNIKGALEKYGEVDKEKIKDIEDNLAGLKKKKQKVNKDLAEKEKEYEEYKEVWKNQQSLHHYLQEKKEI